MRPEVKRNINYSMISRCEDNAKDHAHEYRLLYQRSIRTYLTLRNFIILLVIIMAGFAAYGIYQRAIHP